MTTNAGSKIFTPASFENQMSWKIETFSKYQPPLSALVLNQVVFCQVFTSLWPSSPCTSSKWKVFWYRMQSLKVEPSLYLISWSQSQCLSWGGEGRRIKRYCVVTALRELGLARAHWLVWQYSSKMHFWSIFQYSH